MKAYLICNICKHEGEVDLENYDIESMIKLNTDCKSSPMRINYICGNCQLIIRNIGGVESAHDSIAGFHAAIAGNQKGLQSVYDEFKLVNERLKIINDFFDLISGDEKVIKKIIKIYRAIEYGDE